MVLGRGLVFYCRDLWRLERMQPTGEHLPKFGKSADVVCGSAASWHYSAFRAIKRASTCIAMILHLHVMRTAAQTPLLLLLMLLLLLVLYYIVTGSLRRE